MDLQHFLPNRQRRVMSLCIFGIFFAVNAAFADCETTVQTHDVGQFSADWIDEASGLALAPDGQHFFVTNDSGDLPRFFRTQLDGTGIEDFRLEETKGRTKKPWKPFDVEDIATGPCPVPLTGDCVVIADIGDNRDRRKNIELGFVRLEDLPKTATRRSNQSVAVTLAKKLKLKYPYPDGPRNAEAFAVLNARYGLIVTKEQDRKLRATQAAGVYVVDFTTENVARVGTWDVPTWVKDQGLASLVTGMSVAPAMSSAGALRVLLLTYRDVIEVVAETDILTSTKWPPRPWSVRSRTILKVDPLTQQEAITFDKNATGFYYTTEVPFAVLGSKSAPIRRVEKMTCP